MTNTKVAILGSTGSIGRQVLEVIKADPDRFEVVGLACGTDAERLFAQADEFQVNHVCIGDESVGLPASPNGTTVLRGTQGLCEVAVGTGADVVVIATVGDAGFAPTVAAVKEGKDIALASKEMLVMAGSLITELAKESGSNFLPIDSEHSAMWQCLRGEDGENVSRLILTASGGPFRTTTAEDLASVDPDDALCHPTWAMGSKITIDCSTLMNKGLEVIEARWLFNVPFDSIDVVIHPESVIHSMVEFVDGSIKAQLGNPDMRLPIAHALAYPDRLKAVAASVNFAKLGALHFQEPDQSRFPLLNTAIEAGKTGGNAPAVLCGADDAAVDLFLRREITFPGIANLVLGALDAVVHEPLNDVESVRDFHRAGFEEAMRIARKIRK